MASISYFIKEQQMDKHEKRYPSDGWKITVAKTAEEIETIRPIWEQMQANEPYPVINADVDRYLSVIEASGDSVRPYITLVKQNGQPVAMAIGRVEKHPIKLKLGYKTLLSPKLRCLTVVYGGILGQPTSDLCVVLIGELMKALRRGGVDVVYFNHLRTDSYIYQLSRKLPGILRRGYFPSVETHWSMSVPEDIDQFYRARSKRHRGNLKRYIRRLEKEYPNQTEAITYSQEGDLDDAIKAACQVSHSTYQHGLGCGFAGDSRTRDILTAAARQGWLRMSALYIDGQAGAFQVGLRYRKKYILEQIGFDPKWDKLDLGTVLFLKVLEDICADPDTESIDFGFGDADYKRSYGTEQWEEASVYIFAPRLYPIFINILRTSATGLNIGLEYIVNKTGFAGWIKRRWRNLLQAKSVESRLSEGR